MSASSFIVNLQWYLVHPPSLPPFSYPEDEPSTPPPRTHENIPYQYPPCRLTLPTESNSEYDRKSRLPLPPSVLGSATNYCIGNRLDYQSFDNASELFRVARRASLGTPFVHPISPSLPFHSVCVCVCVFHATANYLLRRSMNSNRNYISSDIQLEAEGEGGGYQEPREKKYRSRLKAKPALW